MQLKEITATELKERLDKNEDILLIDVREPYEHEEFNIGGELIPLAEVAFNTDKLKEYPQADIVLYCRSGNRSAMAQKLLALKFNITNTLNLKGGVLAWKELEKE